MVVIVTYLSHFIAFLAGQVFYDGRRPFELRINPGALAKEVANLPSSKVRLVSEREIH